MALTRHMATHLVALHHDVGYAVGLTLIGADHGSTEGGVLGSDHGLQRPIDLEARAPAAVRTPKAKVVII